MDQELMPQIEGSDQSLHCLPLIPQFFDTSTDNKMDLFKFYDKYGKKLRGPNTQGMHYVSMPIQIYRKFYL